MSTLEVVDGRYIPSDSINLQGKNEKARKEAKSYNMHVQYSNNGFHTLVKSSKGIVTFKDENGKMSSADLRRDILEFLDKSKLTKNMFDKFVDDAKAGKINIEYENGLYNITKVK